MKTICSSEVRRAVVALLLLAGCAGGKSVTSSGGGGQSGSAVCDAKRTLAGMCGETGCHNAADMATAAGLDLKSPGVAARLLGKPSYGTAANGSVCAGAAEPFLVPGSDPAAGLLLEKLFAKQLPCGGRGRRMPSLGALTANAVKCIKSWATGITTGAITE